jgi:hypothetical protein
LQWSPTPTDRVFLERRSGGVVFLHYIDLALKRKAEREHEALRQQKADQGRAEDADRF